MSKRVMTVIVCLGLAVGAADAAHAADARQVFDFYCAQCHGEKGDGKGVNVTKDFATDPRDFSSKADMEKRTDEDIRSVIRDGGPAISKSALMPPWGTTISAQDIEGLLDYIRKMCNCKGK